MPYKIVPQLMVNISGETHFLNDRVVLLGTFSFLYNPFRQKIPFLWSRLFSFDETGRHVVDKDALKHTGSKSRGGR